MSKNFTLLILLNFTSFILIAQTTVVLTTDQVDVQDAWIWTLRPDENYGVQTSTNDGLHNVIRAEVWTWFNDETLRGLLEFDLSSIPPDATITEAKLSLHFFANPQFTMQEGQNDLLIQRINQDWDETTITWNNQPSSSISNQIVLPASTSTTQDYPDIDVTTLVQDMIDSSSTSHGFMLKMFEEVVFKGLSFASSEHTNSALHPTLEITYNMTTSITKELEVGFNIFPNPSSEHIVVEFPTDYPAKIDINDIYGKTIKSISIDFNRSIIDLKDLPNGTYVLNFNLRGERISEKFIKQ